MKMNLAAPLCVVLLLPVLAGCVNDAASLQIDGKEHSISVVREQKWFWEDKVELFVVVTRMPDCQRRHHLKTAPIATASFDVFSPDAVTFYLRQGGRTYSVETKTCESFRELSGAPDSGMGLKIGVFKEVGGQFTFVEEPASPDAATAPAPSRQ